MFVIDRVVIVVFVVVVVVVANEVVAVHRLLLHVHRSVVTLRDVIDAQLLVASKVARRLDFVNQHHVTLQDLKESFLRKLDDFKPPSSKPSSKIIFDLRQDFHHLIS